MLTQCSIDRKTKVSFWKLSGNFPLGKIHRNFPSLAEIVAMCELTRRPSGGTTLLWSLFYNDLNRLVLLPAGSL
jgi:hypothetical protein